jgi:hypothetical protein
VGWNPDGVATTFIISQPEIFGFDQVFFIIEVIDGVTPTLNHFCDVVTHQPEFHNNL